MQVIWHNYLYQPLFNLLIWLYWNNFSFFNLGVAVIYLTILLRIALLPLSIISERGKTFYNELSEKAKAIQKDFADDPVKAKEEIRKLLRKNKVRPWAKVVVLGVQLLVLIVLYRVFLGGIGAHDKLELLYPGMPHPDFINTKFLWFDIGRRDILISLIVGVVLFLEITVAQRSREQFLVRRDILYRFFFPLLVFLILAILPSVKALFILTSILFSIILILARNAFGMAFHKIKR
jgi:YidC/Oxa1 family membrane protein insertase